MNILDRHLRVQLDDPRLQADDTLRAAAASPLFRDMDTGEISDALRHFDEESFNRGHRVTLEGLRGADFFVITAGTARVSVDGWRVATLEQGDFFGELGVLGDGLRMATVTAETPLRCIVLPNAGLDALILRHPRIGVNLLREVVTRFHDLAGRRQPPAAEMGDEARP